MALQAYIDDSRDAHGERVLVLAGYCACEETWSKFSSDWSEYLQLLGIKAFKMSDLSQSHDEMRWELCGHLYRIIERHLCSAFAVAIEIAPLRRVVEELNMPVEYSNPYLLAFRALLEGVAKSQGQMGILEPIDFVFDERAEKAGVLSGFAILQDRKDLEYAHRFGAPPRFERDDDLAPLQAADMLAWIVRRNWERRGTITERGVWELPWRPMSSNMQAFAYNFDYDDIRRTLESTMRALHAEGLVGLMTWTIDFSCDLTWPSSRDDTASVDF